MLRKPSLRQTAIAGTMITVAAFPAIADEVQSPPSEPATTAIIAEIRKPGADLQALRERLGITAETTDAELDAIVRQILANVSSIVWFSE